MYLLFFFKNIINFVNYWCNKDYNLFFKNLDYEKMEVEKVFCLLKVENGE